MQLKDQAYTLNSTLHVLPSNAFVSSVNYVQMVAAAALKLNVLGNVAVSMTGRSALALSSNLPIMYNKAMFADPVAAKLALPGPILGSATVTLESKC